MYWTPTQVDQAALEGWRLADTVDNGKAQVYVMLAAITGGFKNDHEAGIFVVRRAREGSALHQRALSVVMHSRAQPPKGKTK